MAAPHISVVVPTRDERDNAPLVVERVLAALPGVEVEICFVDDSDDDTPGVIARLAERHPGRVRCLHRTGADRAGGLSTAVMAGLREARGTWVCVMDADLQHPPETLAGMLAAAEAGADLVVASRYVAGGSAGGLDGGLRVLVSRSATGLAHLLFSEARRSSDPLSGFFLCRRALVDGVEFRPVGFKILLELLVLLRDVRVQDVPLVFAERTHGASKAGIGQGVQYLRHLRSLVLDVRGSARTWKFGLVGISGLCVFLPLLWLLTGPVGLPNLAAFAPAFIVALTWNTVVNRLWTYADLRQLGADRGLGGYLGKALLSGVLMFALFAALVTIGIRSPLAGLIAAVASMFLNGVANRPAVKALPVGWALMAADRGVAASLGRLAESIGADRAYLAPANAAGGAESALVERAVRSRQAVLLIQAPSYRAQRRTNVDIRSRLVVPVLRDDEVVAAVVCERLSPRAFDQAALEEATAVVQQLAGHLLADARPAVDTTLAPVTRS